VHLLVSEIYILACSVCETRCFSVGQQPWACWRNVLIQLGNIKLRLCQMSPDGSMGRAAKKSWFDFGQGQQIVFSKVCRPAVGPTQSEGSFLHSVLRITVNGVLPPLPLTPLGRGQAALSLSWNCKVRRRLHCHLESGLMREAIPPCSHSS